MFSKEPLLKQTRLVKNHC